MTKPQLELADVVRRFMGPYKEQFGDDWKRCVEQAVIDAKMLLSNTMQDKL